MLEWNEAYGAVLLMGLVIYLHRIGGYVLGLRIGHIGRLRPILEILPGCAIMAILVPAAAQGNLVDFVALGLVVAVMWWTGSVALATVIGLGVLLFGAGLF